MLLNACCREVFFLCVIMAIGGTSALPRVDNNWSHRRPNFTVAQHQAGYRPAVVSYQQPLVRNQTHAQSYNNQQQWPQHNNRPQYNQANQSHANAYKPQQQPSYGQGAFNQTRPSSTWQQPSAPNAYKPQQQPSYNQGAFSQTRPAWQQPNQPQYPSYRSGSNQTRNSWHQPNAPQHPQYPQHPSYGAQNTSNKIRPAWPQPSAPQAPNYPALLNNSNNRPAVPSNSWTPTANQTHLYPQLPNINLPQPSLAVGNNGIPLAPLQPASQIPQGPQNWHSGGLGVLSYGPGNYPAPASGSNKNPTTHQGSSNPYANMFN